MRWAMQECPSSGWMDGWIDGDGYVLGDVFGVKMFMRFYECIVGVGTVYRNALMEYYMMV